MIQSVEMKLHTKHKEVSHRVGVAAEQVSGEALQQEVATGGLRCFAQNENKLSSYREMPDRGRHHQRSDVSAEYKSRGQHSLYDNQRHSRNPKGAEERFSSGRRTKENRKREVTSPPFHKGSAAYVAHERPSTLPRETSVSNHEVYQQQHREALYNLRYILTSRGICQLLEISVNLLIIICAGVPYSNNGGYRDLASLGGIYAYYFGGASAFTGADADRVKELDRLFHQLKRPPYVFTMACGGILMIYACVMFGLGVFRVSYRWPIVLLVEAVVNFLIGLGYIAGLVFYFINIQETYQNPICQEREQMYKSKGHKGFECSFNGADIAGGLFGVAGICVFIFGGVLAVRAFKSMREQKNERTNEDNYF